MSSIINIPSKNIMHQTIECPRCGIQIRLPYPDFYNDTFGFRISLVHIRGITGISIYKTITSTEGNRQILHDFCINSWNHQPFIIQVEQTTAYHNVITELIKQGLIRPEELH